MELDKHYKVRVNPEQSRKIQELLFALGGCWLSGSHFKEPVMLDADCLFLNKLMVLTCAYERGNCYFENKHAHTEIQADDLIALLTDLSKSAENPPQDMKLTPEFEAVEPKFKVGDKVYFGFSKNIEEIERFCDFLGGIHAKSKSGNLCLLTTCCHATPENYERLQATFPHIEFEQPAKELSGSDLAKAMLDKGWKFVPCYVHDVSDDEAIDRKHYATVENKNPTNGYSFISTGETDWKYAVPIDPRTGEPLTQAVLDE